MKHYGEAGKPPGHLLKYVKAEAGSGAWLELIGAVACADGYCQAVHAGTVYELLNLVRIGVRGVLVGNVNRILNSGKPAKLSQPALEVLTVIAYYQPTTRAYVDQIRGVDSSYTVGLLLDRHLIEECGRLQVPGRPRLYRTTKAFLRAFHLKSLDDLPEIPGLEADGQLRLDQDGAVQDPEQ